MADTRVIGSGADTKPAGQFQRPIGGPDTRPSTSPPIRAGEHGCHARTKTGTFCSAYPVKGTNYCVGHTDA